jgi:hypothetical protein
MVEAFVKRAKCQASKEIDPLVAFHAVLNAPTQSLRPDWIWSLVVRSALTALFATVSRD